MLGPVEVELRQRTKWKTKVICLGTIGCYDACIRNENRSGLANSGNTHQGQNYASVGRLNVLFVLSQCMRRWNELQDSQKFILSGYGVPSREWERRWESPRARVTTDELFELDDYSLHPRRGHCQITYLPTASQPARLHDCISARQFTTRENRTFPSAKLTRHAVREQKTTKTVLRGLSKGKILIIFRWRHAFGVCNYRRPTRIRRAENRS